MRTRRSPGASLALTTLKWRSSANAISLGVRLRGAGDVDGARLAFQRAIDFGDLHGTPAGLWWMEEKARAVYERATGGDREQQALFAINPAEELKERGDVDGAAESLREAIELDDPHASPRAATMLSLLPSR